VEFDLYRSMLAVVALWIAAGSTVVAFATIGVHAVRRWVRRHGVGALS
jgi:hypothetical protein